MNQRKTEILFCLILFLSILINQPFLSISFFPRTPRLLIEASILVILFLYSFKDRNYESIKFLIVIFVLLGLSYINSGVELIRYIGTFNKISFAVLLCSFLKNRSYYLDLLIKLWSVLWILICVWVITGSIYFFWDPRALDVVQFSSFDKFAAYPYKISSWGNVFVENKVFGYLVGRNCGVFFEPNILGFVSWLNLLGAKYFIDNLRFKKIYLFLTFAAGLCSISTTFFVVLFMFAPFLIKKLRFIIEKGKNYSLILGAGLLALVCIWISSYKLNSASNRLERLSGAFEMFKNNTISSFFIGNGYLESKNYMKYAFSSGYSDLLLIKGFLFFSLVLYFIYKLSKRDRLLLCSLSIYFVAINPFQFMVFYMIIVFIYLRYESLSGRSA
jgi:hypothetical protein